MRAPRTRRWARALALLAAGAALAAVALDAGTPRADGGSGSAMAAALSAEDLEVIDNLELLENLDASSDLDLLLELSNGPDDAGN